MRLSFMDKNVSGRVYVSAEDSLKLMMMVTFLHYNYYNDAKWFPAMAYCCALINFGSMKIKIDV